MLILMNVLNVDWWISWITDSKQCRREPGRWNCSTSRTDQGIVRWGEIFHFFPSASGRLWDGDPGFIPGSPVKIYRMVDSRARLLEHSGKCVGYVTLYLSLRATRLRHPSVPCCPFTHSLYNRVSQKLMPFYRLVWFSVFGCIIFVILFHYFAV